MIQGKRPDPQNEEDFTQIRLMARGWKLRNLYNSSAKNLNRQQNQKSDKRSGDWLRRELGEARDLCSLFKRIIVRQVIETKIT